mmetsp:Transcript_71320/g.149077  ORF Transcript_71320/g.149077 Transcript_71320/m.149077 type:complete len:217 (+) Transcript_71320:95-745(+)|eukprot:CAMPEP_0206464416 /NCGR_PEP_ID=MMETSP0324_2-20121206/27202_1 /ASSEMBLY_ACC=CAM_ASM_000836 /TAXON_ID=2866 /ORGANISM="Crypthecodinium cohnii, Strain Seligo" /LENGTH=216 /DNA_ID=CAMNT_0053937041 /DNA_START=95 /DNA_END=745 /DNA_ORIENTATION=-
MGASQCKGCRGADPTTDTVKVNLAGSGTLLTDAEAGKTSPKVQTLDQAKIAEEEERERQRLEAEAARAREEEERLLREDEEKKRLAAEAKAEQERLAKEEAEKKAKDAEAEAEALRKKEEVQRQAEAKSLQEAQEVVNKFVKAKGFKGATTPKTSMMKTTYPIHVAASEKKAEVVIALLRCGADKTTKNSAGRTALELAQKLNNKGSHDAVIAALQ